jgi:ribosomal protein S18 acetylase RimI-like enzyme
VDHGEIVGLATFDVRDGQCELVTLDAFTEDRGVGSALLAAVTQEASRQDCRRLWLVTTNDNLPALHFYQRRELRLVAVHRGAVDAARQLKPTIPLVGTDGIAVHDELELELPLPSDVR